MVLDALREIATATEKEHGVSCEIEHEGLGEIDRNAGEKICSAIRDAVNSTLYKKDADLLKIKLTVIQDRAMFIIRSYRESKLQSIRESARWLYLRNGR